MAEIIITISGPGDAGAAAEALADRLQEEERRLGLLRELCAGDDDATIDTSEMIITIVHR